MTTTLSEELQEIHENLATLIAAKDEKDANGETDRYRELKRNAWGNARRAVTVLPRLIERTREMEWRPIETAPRNGTKILLLENGHIYAGQWQAGWWASFCGQPVVYTPDPTHWMPLPDVAQESDAA